MDAKHFETTIVLTFNDRRILDESTIQEVGREMLEFVAAGRFVILDFSRVEFVSSSLFGKFMTLQKKSNAANGRLVLCGIRPEIYETFVITKLTKMFVICEDLKAALAMNASPIPLPDGG